MGKGTRARAGRETTEGCEGAKRSGAPSAKVERRMQSEYRVQSTEYREAAKAVQKCKAEQSSGAKVERLMTKTGKGVALPRPCHG